MKPPAFQFYPDDFIGGTCDMSTKEVGAFIRLLCFQWTKGKIPSCGKKLARIAGTNVTPDVLAKFNDGMNQRLENERSKLEEYRKQKAQSGKNGAEKRWQNHSTPIISPLAEGMANDSSPSPSSVSNSTLTESAPPPPLDGTLKPKKEKKPKIELTDLEWMTDLKSKPENQGINIDAEYSRACEWCRKNGRSPSRRFFGNWLKKAAEDKPLAIVAKKPFQSVTHSAPKGGWKSCL